jgi:hypothetical protein
LGVPIILLCEIFILGYMFDALLCWNWLFSPPLKLRDFIQITLMLCDVLATR